MKDLPKFNFKQQLYIILSNIQYGYDFEKRKAAEVWGFVLNKIVTCASPEEVPSLDEMRGLVRESDLLS